MNKATYSTVLVAVITVLGMSAIAVDSEGAALETVEVKTVTTFPYTTSTAGEGTGTEPSTVDSLDMSGKHTKFSDSGKYIFQTGSTLILGSTSVNEFISNMEIESTLTTPIIELQSGSKVKIGTSETTITETTTLTMNGYVNIDFLINMVSESYDITIDIKENTTVTLAGEKNLTIKGESGLVTEIDITIKSVDEMSVHLDVPSLKTDLLGYNVEFTNLVADIIYKSGTDPSVTGSTVTDAATYGADKVVMQDGNTTITFIDIVGTLKGTGNAEVLNVENTNDIGSITYEIDGERLVIEDIDNECEFSLKYTTTDNEISAITLDSITDGIAIMDTMEMFQEDSSNPLISTDNIIIEYDLSDNKLDVVLETGQVSLEMDVDQSYPEIEGYTEVELPSIVADFTFNMDVIDLMDDQASNESPIKSYSGDISSASASIIIEGTSDSESEAVDLTLGAIKYSMSEDYENETGQESISVESGTFEMNSGNDDSEYVLNATFAEVDYTTFVNEDEIIQSITIENATAKGDTSSSSYSLRGVDLTIEGLFYSSIKDYMGNEIGLRMDVDSAKGKLAIDGETININLVDVDYTQDEDGTLANAEQLDITVEPYSGYAQKLIVEGSGFNLEIDGDEIRGTDEFKIRYVSSDNTESFMKISFPDGVPTITYSGFEQAPQYKPGLDDGFRYILEDVHIQYMDLTEYEDINGTVIIPKYGELTHEDGTLINEGQGVYIVVTIDDGVIESAEIVLREGYESLPRAGSGGLDYDLNKDHTVGTLDPREDYDGSVTAEATSKTFEVYANGKTYEAGIGEKIVIEAPKHDNKDYEFIGWTDGVTVMEDYALYTPYNVSLNPVFAVSEWRVHKDVIIVDATEGNGLYLEDSTKLFNQIFDSNIKSMIVETKYGTVEIEFDFYMSLSSDMPFSVLMVEGKAIKKEVANTVGDRTMYNIVSDIMVKSFTLNHDGKAEGLHVYSVSSYGVYKEYSNVTSTTEDDKSTFTIMNFDLPNFNSYGIYIAESPTDDGGISIAFIAGVVVGILVVAVLVYLIFVKKVINLPSLPKKNKGQI